MDAVMEVLTIGLGATAGVAAVSYGTTQFYLWPTNRMSTQDVFLCTFLIWSMVMNALMGVTYVFMGGAGGSLPVVSDLWKDYAKFDARFAAVTPEQQALMVLALVMVPLSYLTLHAVLTGGKLRLFLQTVVGMGYFTGAVIMLLSEVFAGMSHINFGPVPLGIYVLLNAPFLVGPGYMLFQAFVVANGGALPAGAGAGAVSKGSRGGSKRR